MDRDEALGHLDRWFDSINWRGATGISTEEVVLDQMKADAATLAPLLAVIGGGEPAPREAELEAALRAFVEKLPQCEKALGGIYGIAHAHGFTYDGPTYTAEMESARRLLGIEAGVSEGAP
jgi:hypothetical protein